MARDLPRLPLKAVPYRDRALQEFDLDAALASARQHAEALVLLDELAHSNAPGSRHPKRWQDVEELLDAGIDVWSTMNVQHLESLNDIVSGITGIRVWETVPDRLFDEADEVVVVDLPPDELLAAPEGRQGLPAGSRPSARPATSSARATCWRCASWRCAARPTASTTRCRPTAGAASVQTVWPNREALLACVGPGEHGEKVVRSLRPPGGAARRALARGACRDAGGAAAARGAARAGAARAQAGAGTGRAPGHAGRARGRRGAGALCARAQPVAAGDRPRAAALALAALARPNASPRWPTTWT